MARRTRIVFVTPEMTLADRLVGGLREAAFDVISMHGVGDSPPGRPDLVLINANDADAVDTVRACRANWPEPTIPMLVIGSPDAAASAAAIDAGASDSIVDHLAGPVPIAHVRRLLQIGDAMRTLLAAERRRTERESLTHAAADLAVPLGKMLDELEAVMARKPVDEEELDGLLEWAGRAVDVVDRLRRRAADD